MSIPITGCERLDHYTRNKKRVVRVMFLFMKHKTCLLSWQSNLPSGIYVEEAYSEAVKHQRSILRPILKLALKKEGYKGKCKLDQDQLILKGIKYNVETLDKLPEELATHKATQHTSTECLVFHGQHMPLSNFHLSSFIIENQKFASAEHYVQYKKACHFNDYKMANKILQCKHAHEAKTLSCNIENYNTDAWKRVAKDACTPGIKAKFVQNPLLLEFLRTTKPLKLAECTYDKLWGTGLPLNDINALKPAVWANQGLLGEILEEIRELTTT